MNANQTAHAFNKTQSSEMFARISGNNYVKRLLTAFRYPLLISFHTAIFALAYWLAFLTRFDFATPSHWQLFFIQTLPIVVGIQLASFFFFDAFNGWWRYFTFRDVTSLSHPLLAGFLAFGLVDFFFFTIHAPRSIHLYNTVLAGILICSLRSVWRLSKEGYWQQRLPNDCKPALLVCNTNESAILANQINNLSNANVKIVGILSDHPDIVGVKRAGMKVLGSPIDAPKISRDLGVKEIWSVAGDINGKELNLLKAWYDQHNLPLRILPAAADWASSDGKIPLREIDIHDLLQREPVKLDTDLIGSELEGKRVLVTGAGGSIGSEICRQLIQFDPSELVLVDHRENSVFMIHNELKRLKDENTRLVPAVGDILDSDRMRHLFSEHQPHFVYHAAAHKHVGLMEISPGEAIKNNIVGTRKIAELSDEHNVKKFVLVSTDKAVNPTSLMGCTKHLAERFILSFAQTSETAFVIVRFGNVLGSNGSVVPLFKEQIARGGPLTLTDPRMTRFFMTIPEASQLVLQAGSMGQGGEIFVLDMGEQVLILDLAKTLIQLSGLPTGAIEIQTVGIRPGEKLYEELHIDPDQLLETDHPKINAAWQASEPLAEISNHIEDLVKLAYSRNEVIRQHVKKLIPEYQNGMQPQSHNQAQKAVEASSVS